MNSKEDENGLGRWVSTKLRGAEGRAIRIVSVYGPCDNKGGLESVAAQHRNYIGRGSFMLLLLLVSRHNQRLVVRGAKDQPGIVGQSHKLFN